MKSSIIILSAIIPSLIACAENNSRFPISPTSEWRINYEIMEDTIHLDGNEIFKLYVKDDTLINSKMFFKLYKSGYAYYNPIFYFDHVYLGAIRDEDNKYYFIKKDNSTEDLLYDFDLETDDTINSSIEKGMVITSTEVLTDGRKKIKFHKIDFQHGECMNFNNTYLIEGIGSMGGFLYESPCNHVGFREYCLVCYSENGSIVYNNALSTRDCFPDSDIPDLAVENPNIRLYPIPVINKLIIEFQNWECNSIKFQIYNVAGTTKYAGTIMPSDNKIEINIQNLSKGIYLINLINEVTCISKRFIVE